MVETRQKALGTWLQWYKLEYEYWWILQTWCGDLLWSSKMFLKQVASTIQHWLPVSCQHFLCESAWYSHRQRVYRYIKFTGAREKATRCKWTKSSCQSWPVRDEKSMSMYDSSGFSRLLATYGIKLDSLMCFRVFEQMHPVQSLAYCTPAVFLGHFWKIDEFWKSTKNMKRKICNKFTKISHISILVDPKLTCSGIWGTLTGT